MHEKGSRWWALILAVLILHCALVDCAPYRKSHLKTIRLCSRSLSDALYMICLERGGYNEPYSGEDARGPLGPGLAEECCRQPCSYTQLEQYCKASSEEKPESHITPVGSSSREDCDRGSAVP